MFFANFTSLFEFLGSISLALVGFSHLQEFFYRRFRPRVEQYHSKWDNIDNMFSNLQVQSEQTLESIHQNGLINSYSYRRYKGKLTDLEEYKTKEITFSKNPLLFRSVDEEELYAKKIVRLLASWSALYCGNILLLSGFSLSNELSNDYSEIFFLNIIANFTAFSFCFYVLFRLIVLINRVYVYNKKIELTENFANSYVNTFCIILLFIVTSLISICFSINNINIISYSPITVLWSSILLCLIPIIGLCDRYLLHLPLRVWNRKRAQKNISKKIRDLSLSYEKILEFRKPNKS